MPAVRNISSGDARAALSLAYGAFLGAASALRVQLSRESRARAIAEYVATEYGLSLAQLRAGGRTAVEVEARGVGMWLARRLTGATWQCLGALHGRHHSSVMLLVRSVSDRRSVDEEFAAHMDEISARLEAAERRDLA